MKFFCIGLIELYQRFVSPYKGFHCAHHVLHKKETCSNAVKQLVAEHGVFKARPLIGARFKECRSAYNSLQANLRQAHTSDLPCVVPDVPCDIGIGDCGGAGSASSSSGCVWPCDLLYFWEQISRKTQRRILIASSIAILVLSYVFYGRDISAVYVTELVDQKQSIVKRLSQRKYPQVRIVLLIDGEKYYSEIVEFQAKDVEYKLSLEKPSPSFDIDSLQVLDARLNIGNKLVVVGQVLEQFNKPQQSDEGQRFSYRIKRRWHF